MIRLAHGDPGRFGIDLDDGGAVEGSYGRRIAFGRLSCLVPDTRAVGSYVAIPLQLPDGRLSGSLCCVSEAVTTALDPRHVELMRVLARLVGDQLDRLEAAELARAAQEEVFAAFAHDVRAPLAPIRGYAELLGAEHGGHAITERAAGAILRNAARLEGVLDDMLLLVRHRTAALRPMVRRVDLAALVSEAVAAAQPAAAERAVHVVLSGPAEPVELRADAALLRRVLDTLFANAVRFSHEDGEVRVRVRHGPDGALVDVEDDGIGIDEHDLGTGLGLSVCQAVVTAHGGTLGAEYVPDRGSTFTLRMPLDPG